MRLGRIILISLSALGTAGAGEQGGSASSSVHSGKDSLARLLRSVVHLVTPAAEYTSVSAPSGRPSPQAVLELSALAATPFRHSLWLVENRNHENLAVRRHPRPPPRL